MRLQLLLISLVLLQGGSVQEVNWPVHRVCKSGNFWMSYSSCDPLQDVGFTFNPCPSMSTETVNVRVALLLRQPIDELYLSVDLSLNGKPMLHHDEPLCLPHFPRFSFCGKRRGELISVERPLHIIRVKGRFDLHILLTNQNGFHIACLNANLTLM